MQKINKYILEKLHISKNFKNALSIDDYLCIIAYNDAYQSLFKNYADGEISSKLQPHIFVIPKSDAIEFYKKHIDDSYVDIYYIPDEYDNLDDFAKDWETGNTCENDLTVYKV